MFFELLHVGCFLELLQVRWFLELLQVRWFFRIVTGQMVFRIATGQIVFRIGKAVKILRNISLLEWDMYIITFDHLAGISNVALRVVLTVHTPKFIGCQKAVILFSSVGTLNNI